MGARPSPTRRPLLPSVTIPICSCGAAQIQAPEGSTLETRFTCRRCCARLARRRNVAECRAWAHQAQHNQAAIAAAKQHLILRIVKSED